LYNDESSDNGGNGTWIRKPQAQTHSEEKPKLKVQIETTGTMQSPSSAEKSNPSTGSTATLLAPPSLSNLRGNSSNIVNGTGSSTRVGDLSGMMTTHERERERERENENEGQLEKQVERAWQKEQERERGTTTETFTDSEDGWALRPPPEAVYERLEHYFRNHDLDKPVIEATSGGTSPTSTEPVAPPQAAVMTNYDKEREKLKRSKKSIRYVAEDAKRRIDRTSAYAECYLKKRNTKFWGGKLEEVTTHQAKSSSVSSASSPSPDSVTSTSTCHILSSVLWPLTQVSVSSYV
jgi:mitogen-activated protein kinase kinase kinase